MSGNPRKLRVLVADDDPIIRDAYEAFLTDPDDEGGAPDIGLAAGTEIELVCCEDAETAVAAVARSLEVAEPFALAFLDVSMPPGPDGIWAAEQIRKLDAAIEIVIVTAYSDISPAEITSRVPPPDKLLYLQKPFHPHEITQLAVALGAKWRAERNLARSLVRFETAQQIAQFGHWDYDPQSGEARWSDEMGRLFGISKGESAGPLEVLWRNVHAEDRPGVIAGVERVLSGGQGSSLDYRIVLPGGEERTIQHEVVSIPGDSVESVRLVGAVLDLTERKKSESRIHYLAYHDPLTGLLNRSFLNQHVPMALETVARKKGFAALLYLDLDHFKRINDTLGHSTGDELLQQVAHRLSESVRGSDCVARPGREAGDSEAPLDEADPIARLGGDEFIVLLPEVREVEDPARVAERIRASLEIPFEIGGQELYISSSIGIALYPKDGRDVESLLQCADLALYHAKDGGRNNYQFYTKELNAQARERLAREGELRQALSQQEFMLYYQPTIDVQTGALSGAEALVRWQHPEHGLVGPADFISIAEDAGLIIPLGDWVFREACLQLSRWQAAGSAPSALSVNLSFRQFKDEELTTRFEQILEETGIDPGHLIMEFTESVLMDDSDRTSAILGQFQALGLRTAMDDFGTGYSSLSYLKRLSIDILKMDRSFVSGLDSNGPDEAIAKAIINLAHELNLQVTAEGVERQEQLELLKAHGCDVVQGYLIDRPMPADEFASRWLSKAG